jgi:hypothetical protein
LDDLPDGAVVVAMGVGEGGNRLTQQRRQPGMAAADLDAGLGRAKLVEPGMGVAVTTDLDAETGEGAQVVTAEHAGAADPVGDDITGRGEPVSDDTAGCRHVVGEPVVERDDDRVRGQRPFADPGYTVGDRQRDATGCRDQFEVAGEARGVDGTAFEPGYWTVAHRVVEQYRNHDCLR